MAREEQPGSFGALLRRHRLDAGLTQEALAGRAGLSVRTVQHLERGLGQPYRDTSRRLVDALALTAEPRTQFERAAAPAPRSSPPSRGVASRDRPARRAVSGGVAVDPDPDLGQRPVRALSGSLVPITLTSFIGRERELADLRTLLETRRLLTLTGPGGVGKTRLALELMDRVQRAYPDGTYIVSLAPLTDPGLVASTMAEAFGIHRTVGRSPLDSLARFIGDKTVLVLLDNFEHLPAARALLVDLLSACPKLTMLVTSREVLRLRGEQVYPVPPLTLPRGDVLSVRSDPVSVVSESEAVRLFVDRAQRSQPAFRLDASNASAVADICRRLDGLPLAIKLAAVRVRLLSPEALRVRLEHRLMLLTGGAHDLPVRQRTLRDAIAWSYDLLSEPDRALFRRLAVFEGGFTLEAAEAICREDGDPDRSVIDGIDSLIAQSLVQQHEGVDGEPRYTMLETIREYAREQLEASDEGPAVRDHHGDWFLAFVEATEPRLRGPRQVAWFERLTRDHDNVRAALRYAVETHRVEAGLRLAGALWRFWQVRGHLREGRAWLDRLLALPEASARTAGRARALNAAGFVAFLLGDYPTARALHEESLAIRRELGEPHGVVESLHNLGLTVRCQAEHVAAQTHFLEGLTISRTIADHFWEARLLLGLARTYFYQGEPAASGALLEESLRIATEVGDLVGQAIALGDLSDIAHALGEVGRARALIVESFALWRGLHDERGMAQCAEGLALQVGVLDQLDPAVRLLSSASALRVAIGEPPSPSRQQQLDRLLARARSILGDAAYTAAWAAGAARPASDLVDEWLIGLESHDGMAELPRGTLTFLFTDVEGSTALWEEAPEAMRAALARHDGLFEQAVAQHGGVHIRPRGEGDSRFAVFASASDAVAAAVTIQRALAAEPWPTPRPIKIRIGLHTGEAELRDRDYYGSAVNRCARLRNIARGGQVLLSETTAGLAARRLPDGASLRDRGEHRLKDLTVPEHVFQLVAPDLPTDDAPLASLQARRHNLPVQPAALLGREQDVAEIRALLLRPDVRLLTLTGPGGTGKTRLGLQVAAELTDLFEDGVYFVALGPIVDPALVPSAIAQALGVRDTGGRSILESLAIFLRDRHLLLVLDNFEQVLPAGLTVAELLTAATGLKVLVTSRAPLQIRGEHEVSVSPLAFPIRGQVPSMPALGHYPAVALFVERVQAVHPSFVVTAENAPAVAEVCARLDGLPLAIELAAARVRTLSPEAMLRRLERRLPLLTGGARDLPRRQQTLRDAIGWSYDLLTPEEQGVFRRLGVFSGGCTLSAGSWVLGPGNEPNASSSPTTRHLEPRTLELLDSLVAQSLVLQQRMADGEPRFGMLETIREYALERLDEAGELDAVRRQHAAYFGALADEAEPHLRTARQIEWLRRLDPEHDNLRAALTWSRASGDVETGLRIAGALCWYWVFRGYVGEGRDRLSELLGMPGGSSRSRARALQAAGLLAILQAEYATARSLGRQSADLFAELGDRSGVGTALTCIGIADLGESNIAAARPVLEEAVAACREAGDRRGLAQALSQLASVFRQGGDLPAALTLREKAAAIARQRGDRWTLGMALMGAATIVRAQGDLSRSTALYREALAVLRELEERWLTPRAIEGLAGCALLDGDHPRAARLFGAAAALREASGTREMSLWRVLFDRDIADLKAAMSDLAFTTTWAEGRAMTLERAVAYALDEQPPE